ncbi:MAG TPA: hypothetical protein VN132_09085, partial [Bdellovibrio sp.]|nr:hypothetical protein [Bdellovibrio sp.]
MGSDFKIYVNIYRNSKFDEQWSGWKVFEKKYQKYFDAAICDSSDGDCESAKKTHLKEFFTQLPNFESEMWTIFDNANILSDNQILQFKIYFPDTPTDVPIVFMPSLLTFNGKGGVQIDGTYTLVIGADLAALRKNNMKVLFSHEFFHTYQFGKLTGAPLFQTLASPLWFEGLAVWVSEKLNPEASDADILMSQDLATYCASNEHVIGMAKDYK